MRNIIFIGFILVAWFMACSPAPELDQVFKPIDPVLCRGDESLRPPEQSEFLINREYPTVISESAPEYPQQALTDSIEGRVGIWVYVDGTGNVLTACATYSTRQGYGFEEAAVNAALKSMYKPAVDDGQPIGEWVSFIVVFSLEE